MGKGKRWRRESVREEWSREGGSCNEGEREKEGKEADIIKKKERKIEG